MISVKQFCIDISFILEYVRRGCVGCFKYSERAKKFNFHLEATEKFGKESIENKMKIQRTINDCIDTAYTFIQINCIKCSGLYRRFSFFLSQCA